MSDDEPRTKSYHGPYDRKRRNVLKTLAAGGLAGALGGTVLTGSTVAQPDKGAENSGKFVLEGTADIVSEPDVRPTNHVLEIDTSADGLFGSASRKLGVKAGDLDGSLSFDYFIVSGDCGGGSPRLILSIDDDGDGEHDFYLVTDGSGSPGWETCPGAANAWDSFDATDNDDTYWRKHPGGPYATWDGAKGLLSSDHMVLSGGIVDDSYWKSGVGGVAYYDNVQVGDRTLNGHSDVVGSQ